MSIVLTQQRAKSKLTGYQYVNKCTMESCPITDACPHCGNVVMCKLHKDYMATIMNNVQSLIDAGVLDAMQASIACTSILPLYNHLFKFQLLEMAQESPVIYGKQIYMHPVYKEMRNTMKTIFELWKGLGVVKSNVPMTNIAMGNDTGLSYIEALTSGTKATKEVKEVIANLPDDPVEDDYDDKPLPVVRINMQRGEVQRAKKGVTGKAKEMFDKLDAMGEEVRNKVMVAGEDEFGNPVLVPADFDPTKLPEDAIQTSFIDTLKGADHE